MPATPAFPTVPPAAQFKVGKKTPAFTAMGKRIQRWLGHEAHHDGDGYQPGPVFSTFDVINVKLCQQLMGVKQTGVLTQKQWTTLMTSLPDREFRVTAQALNVRARPRLDAEAVGFLREGDIVTVTGRSRDRYWRKISQKKAGFEGTDSAAARSWEDWGVRLVEPVVGCVAVFWRNSPTSGEGHVGFYMGETESTIKTLGGNQADAVNIASQHRTQLLSYRMPGRT
ncbi:MAG TPA: TIGR02594 family protein [Nocardioidaceae bacterium]|nr:TIGR02594 family protein [Nocardioidaceae bacterium]